MSDIVKTITVNRIVIFYIILFSVYSLGTAIAASLVNAEWSDLSPTSKFLTIVMIIVNWSGTMLAFMNKAIARIENNQPPIQEGDITQPTKK